MHPRVLVATALLVTTAVAHAQPAPPIPPPPTPAPVAIDPAWSMYDDAFRALAKGDTARARAVLEALRKQYPDHVARAKADAVINQLAAEAAKPPPPDDESNDKVSNTARGEFIFWTSAGSTFVGYNVCKIAHCGSPRGYAIGYGLVVAGTLAGTIALSKHMHQGQAQLYDSAQTWTAWNSLAVFNGVAKSDAGALVSIAMQGAGGGVAAGLWDTWHPTKGDIALTNSFWVWSSLLGTWTFLAADAGNHLSFRAIVAIGDAGILGGALASTRIHMSRGRTLLLDTGGILGTLSGLLIAVVASSSKESVIGGAMLVGTGAGLGASYLLTQDWDAPSIPVQLAPMPVVTPSGNTSMGVGATLRW